VPGIGDAGVGEVWPPTRTPDPSGSQAGAEAALNDADMSLPFVRSRIPTDPDESTNASESPSGE
jgi:hypothetical protein